MDLTSKQNIKDLLNRHGLKPLKRLGQNFLVDQRALDKVIAAAQLTSQDTVLEIGPGIGTLTQELAKKAGRVVAIEKDRNMVEILKETLQDLSNIEIIQADIRKIQDLKLEIGNYKLVGNLPFYLTAPVIREFLECQRRPKMMVLMVQKEVGQRICSKPPDMNLFAVSVQVYAEPKIISYVSKNSFWPQPEVNAAIIKITPKPSLIAARMGEPRLRRGDADLFFKIVKAGFSQPRKQLINNLSKGLKIDKKKVGGWLQENGIQPTQRAETLRVEDWLKLAENNF